MSEKNIKAAENVAAKDNENMDNSITEATKRIESKGINIADLILVLAASKGKKRAR